MNNPASVAGAGWLSLAIVRFVRPCGIAPVRDGGW